MNPKRSGQAGFTLVEMLVVLLIISILGGIVAVNVLDKPGEAKVTATRAQMGNLETGLAMYKTQQGRFPTQAQGLEALVQRPRSGPLSDSYPEHGYLTRRTLPKDAWRHPFIYLIPGRQGEAYEIISYGRDGRAEGEGEDADLSTADVDG